MITCPSCGQRIRIQPGTITGRCPRCAAELMITALSVRDHEPPPIVAPRPAMVQPVSPPVTSQRLEAAGWFTRSFAVVMGIIAALIVFSVLSCAGVALGILGVGTVASQIPNRQSLAAPVPAPSPVPGPSQEPASPKPKAKIEDSIRDKVAELLASRGYTGGIFFDEIRAEEKVPDATHTVTGDIRTSTTSTPFTVSARVSPAFDGHSVSFERVIVGGTQLDLGTK